IWSGGIFVGAQSTNNEAEYAGLILGLQSPLNRQAKALARAFERIEYRHIPRECNARADALANRAMD
ncbi:unnamed protein product, partial [Phaeothamnion confervicola]